MSGSYHRGPFLVLSVPPLMTLKCVCACVSVCVCMCVCVCVCVCLSLSYLMDDLRHRQLVCIGVLLYLKLFIDRTARQNGLC